MKLFLIFCCVLAINQVRSHSLFTQHYPSQEKYQRPRFNLITEENEDVETTEPSLFRSKSPSKTPQQIKINRELELASCPPNNGPFKCEVECVNNDECSRSSICCKHRCGSACVALNSYRRPTKIERPIEENDETEIEEEPIPNIILECPKVNTTNQNCKKVADTCSYDSDCNGFQKCCQIKCGRACIGLTQTTKTRMPKLRANNSRNKILEFLEQNAASNLDEDEDEEIEEEKEDNDEAMDLYQRKMMVNDMLQQQSMYPGSKYGSGGMMGSMGGMVNKGNKGSMGGMAGLAAGMNTMGGMNPMAVMNGMSGMGGMAGMQGRSAIQKLWPMPYP